jgi:hypothetical protein
MRWMLMAVLALGCGKDPDFEVPARDDMRITLDLASSFMHQDPDMSCLSTACGGCSYLTNWDGSPVEAGDPCLWKGTWQCAGTQLTCSDDGCPTCGTAMTGSLCGADGHTIVEITNMGACGVYDFGSAIAVCNRTPGDHCVSRCTLDNGVHHCAARCASADGGAMGCEHSAAQTCEALTSC